jgi:protein SCO1/2
MRELHRVVGSGGSFGSNPLRQEIGLGDAAAIVAVDIRWPGSNTRQTCTGLQPNHSYQIREGDADPVLLRVRPVRLDRHREISGDMPQMTMESDVRDTNELRGLLAGEAITFEVKATGQESSIEDIPRIHTNEWRAPVSADPTASSLLRIASLKPGEVLPDAEFLAEDERVVKLSDFEGSALAFTFIFTRCPLPDFCPRMNRHFWRARERLLQQRGGPNNWQFLSISFDPEYDRPGVLSRYAHGYRGQNADRWIFAAASTNVMAAMASQLDFRFAREGGTFLHNLRTVVIDPKRRLHRQFEGNKWKAEELARAMTEAALRQE